MKALALSVATTLALSVGLAQEQLLIPRDAFFWVSGNMAYTSEPFGSLMATNLDTFDSIALDVSVFVENEGRALAGTSLGSEGFVVFGKLVDSDGELASGLLLLDSEGTSLGELHVTAKGFRQGRRFHSMVGLSDEVVAAYWIGDVGGQFSSGASLLRISNGRLEHAGDLFEAAPIEVDGADLQTRRDLSFVQAVDGQIYVFDALADRIARFDLTGTDRQDLPMGRLPQAKVLLGGSPADGAFYVTYVPGLNNPNKLGALVHWDGCVSWRGPVERPRTFPVGNGRVVTRFGREATLEPLTLASGTRQPCSR